MVALAFAASVARAEPLQKQVKVAIESTPSGATVAIDGRDQTARTPMSAMLARGHHTLAISLAGHQPERRAFDVRDAGVDVTAVLIRAAAPRDPKAHIAEAASAELVKDVTARGRALVDAGKLKVAVRNGDPTIVVPADILFDASKPELKAPDVIAKIAQLVMPLDNLRFVVIGHTDSAPVKTELFRDAAELSVARAVAVTRALIAAGVSSTDLTADGRGSAEPLGDDKRANRRIEIVILPRQVDAAFDTLIDDAKHPKTDDKPKNRALSSDDFKRGMAAIATQAQACYKGTQGTAAVKLTVDPSGKVTKATVGGQFAGKPEGDCVAAAVKSATFPAWDGAAQNFAYSYLLAD
jgi:flagellar motor protein MotB